MQNVLGGVGYIIIMIEISPPRGRIGSMKHESHTWVVNRLKRADGHLRKVIGMIEEARPCLDVAQQLHAVEKAITEAKKTYIRDHIDHCLDDSAEFGSDSRTLVRELKELSKYL
jgi:DNA-binding FrmR family transcriptional regulator